jgi:hypothetical protein
MFLATDFDFMIYFEQEKLCFCLAGQNKEGRQNAVGVALRVCP